MHRHMPGVAHEALKPRRTVQDPASIVLVFTNSSSYATRLLGTRLNRPVSSWHTNCSFNAGMFVHRFGHFLNPTHRGSRATKQGISFAHQNKDVAIPVHDRRAHRLPHHMSTLCGVLRGDSSLNRALLSPKDSLCDTRSPILAVLKAGTEPNARQVSMRYLRELLSRKISRGSYRGTSIPSNLHLKLSISNTLPKPVLVALKSSIPM